MLRETPLPKSPTCLTNEQVEEWMRANPDRVQILDNTVYNRDARIDIRVNPKKRKRAKPLDDKAIQDALTKQQRQTASSKQKKTDESLNRLQRWAKRRDDWLEYLRKTGKPMTKRQVKEMFGITDPRLTASYINRDGDHISIVKKMHKSRKTLIFRAVKKD